MKQISKANWLLVGDLDTKCFHQMASARKKRNCIGGLENDQGEWVESQGVENIVLSYFSTLFQATESLSDIDKIMNTVHRSISEAKNVKLLVDFEPEEFRIAVLQMHKDKSPGSDGLNSVFYKKLWDVVGPDNVASCIQWWETDFS